MSDDKTKRGGSDRKRVSLNEDYEVQFWTTRLGASREELEEAVKSVGNDADKIREHLRSKTERTGTGDSTHEPDPDFDRDRNRS